MPSSSDQHHRADEPHYAEWVAPKGDQEWLLWPVEGRPADADGQLIGQGPQSLHEGVKHLGVLVAGNAALLEAMGPGLDLKAVRGWTRAQFGLADGVPVIATGHQIEPHHPGVWVKTVVMDLLARAVGGRAVYLAVDTDGPKHLAVAAPATREGLARCEIPLTDDPAATQVAFAGAVGAPSPAHILELERFAMSLGEAYGYELPLTQYLARFREVTIDQSGAAGEGVTPVTRLMADATHAIDSTLGLDYAIWLAGSVWETPAFIYWLARMMADPASAATTYNQAIEGYRVAHGITTAGRPMPPLLVTPTEVELPFWLDNVLTAQRVRLTVKRGGDGPWQLAVPWPIRSAVEPVGKAAFDATPFDEAAALARALRANGLRASARALTLTLFMRLALADVFIHGLGGGRYDQVADAWIRAWLGVAPPRFIVATATQRLPFGTVGSTSTSVRDALRQAHKALHTLPGKAVYLQRIAGLPRRSPQRRTVFSEMHGALEQYRQAGGSVAIASAVQGIEQAKIHAARLALLGGREFHYCLMPWETLAEWAGRGAR